MARIETTRHWTRARQALAPTLLLLGGIALLQCRANADADQTARQQQEDPTAAGRRDREFNVQVLTTIAEPVLDALSRNELKQRFPVHEWEQERAAFTHTEAFARTLAGVAPWLELGPDETPEGQLRARFIELARQALVNATNPDAPDFLNWGDEQGDQPLVEGAYLASALMAAPGQLWDPLDQDQKDDVLEALRTSRAIENTHNNNWYLFPAMIDAALWRLTGEVDVESIEFAVRKFEDDWYLGDGTYSDGPDFSWDYYNSYVIHPFLLQILQVAERNEHPIAESREAAMRRALRYAQVLERMISPEGTFPVIGRSSAYRFAAFYQLSYLALRRDLPQELDKGGVRGGITAVVRRMYEAPGTFDDQGWLQLGAVGQQQGLQETYNATGSLYVALTGLVYLGLPAADEFWTAPEAPWTQKRIWAGDPEVQRDEELDDREEDEDEGNDDNLRAP
jgi:hypothetical protein